ATLRAQQTPEIVFNYLGQFDQVVGSSSLFQFAAEGTGSWYGASTKRPHLLEVNALTIDGCLELRWSFSKLAHKRATIDRMANLYGDALRAIITHCTAAGICGNTPSDFPLAALDQVTLDALAARYGAIEDVYPLTPMQELFIGASDAENDPGFEQWRYRVVGDINVRALNRAWDLVVARHAILRTGFAVDELKVPQQVVRRNVVLPFAEHDWRAVSATEQTTRLEALLAADRHQGFSIDSAPLMRIMLVRLADSEFELVWSNHHLLLDRWSWPLILQEVEQAYTAFAAGREPALAPAARFADFISWQKNQPSSNARDFWARHFDGFEPPPRLAMTRADANLEDASEIVVGLSRADTRALQTFARAQQLSASTVIGAAWALCLSRRSGHLDVSFGVAVAGRDAPVAGIERLVGLTLNNLPQRVRLAPAATAGEWLRTAHDAQTELQQYAYVPLGTIQRWSGVPWRTRLFETLLVFQHDDAEERTAAWLGAGVETRLTHVPTRTAYPLSVIVAGRDALEFRITYDARFYDEAGAHQMGQGLLSALRLLTQSDGHSVAELLSLLPAMPVSESAMAVSEYMAPRTATESVLARVWGEVFGLPRVGVLDNFFMLGGYSLVATQIASRIRTTLKTEAPVRLLFQHPTVAELAVALAARDRKPGQLERIAQVVERVQSLSLEELRRENATRTVTT
ncbi:MAG: condensation domain-containing protein, partial [Gemmatimonadaceae bacterium]